MMHHQPLIEMLARYQKQHPEEAAMIDRIRKLAMEFSNCFDRNCLPGHLTGSAWVLSEDRTECVLLHHGRLGRWLQPGGHADGQSDLAAVARREVQEETGLIQLELVLDSNQEVVPLDVDVHQIPARYDSQGNLLEPSHQHHDLRFLFIAEPDQRLKISAESNDLGWFSHNQVCALTDESSVLRMLAKAGPYAPSS